MTLNLALVNAAFQLGNDKALVRQACTGADVVAVVEGIRRDGSPVDFPRLVPPGWTVHQHTANAGTAGSVLLTRDAACHAAGVTWHHTSGPGVGLRRRFTLRGTLFDHAEARSGALLVTHVPPKRNPFARRTHMRNLRTLTMTPLSLVVGDFNMSPQEAADRLGLDGWGVEVMGLLTDRVTLTDTRTERTDYSDHPILRARVTFPKAEAPVTYRYLTNLADVCRAAGLNVVEVAGWQTRGRPASTGGFAPVGVLVHHTATGIRSSDADVVRLLVNGRSDLPGPLCQLGLARDGTVYVIAAGRANHAGNAKASGTVAAGDGNRLYIGVEAFNDGVGEPWPQVQYDAYVRLAAALCQGVTGNSVQTVRGHKETSVTGKIDPTFDMDTFRANVSAAMVSPRPAEPKKKRRPRFVRKAVSVLNEARKKATAKGRTKRAEKIRDAVRYLRREFPRR